MKIEHLLVQHFYKQKEVTLQGIGTFSLSPDFVLPMDNDKKESAIPENVISFKFDQRATEDDALINYIVEQTRKMRPLAAADLDSYLVLGKQFLNIGKPFKIEGLGMLLKNQQGEYQFTQGTSLQSKPEETPPTIVKEKLEEPETSFSDETRSSSGNKNFIKAAAAILVLAVAGTAIWYFFMRNNEQSLSSNAKDGPAMQQSAPDTTQNIATAPDSTSLKKDSATLLTAAPVTPNGNYTFRVVFRVLSKNGALKKKEELNKSNVIMYSSDSVHYKLAETYTLPLSDTSRIKDSLRIFYAFRTFVEVNH